MTLRGTPCQHLATKGTKFCWQHHVSRRDNPDWWNNTLYQFLAGVILAVLGILATIYYGRIGATKEGQDKGLATLNDVRTEVKEESGKFVNEGVISQHRDTINPMFARIGKRGGFFPIEADSNEVFDLWKSASKATFLIPGIVKNEIYAAIKDGRIYVSGKLFDRKSDLLVELVSNEWKVASSPITWDRNFTTNALEVRDSTGDVVLQVVLLGHELCFQAKLFGSDGTSIVFVEPSPNCLWQVFRKPDELVKIRPYFLYPSSKHLGELNVEPESKLDLPNVRLRALIGHEMGFFDADGHFWELTLVLPVGQTIIPFEVSNDSASPLTNVIAAFHFSPEEFVRFPGDQTNNASLVANIDYIPARTNFLFPVTFQSKPKFKTFVPCCVVTVYSQSGVWRAGFLVRFQEGVTSPYALYNPYISSGRRLPTPRDYYIDLQKSRGK